MEKSLQPETEVCEQGTAKLMVKNDAPKSFENLCRRTSGLTIYHKINSIRIIKVEDWRQTALSNYIYNIHIPIHSQNRWSTLISPTCNLLASREMFAINTTK